jgi:ABC-type branched-subunit amino acid transport system ATPase component
LAAISGALAGAQSQVISGANYQPIESLLLFTLVVISVGGEPWYAIISAAVVTLIPSYVQGGSVANVETLIFGLAALLYGLAPMVGVPECLRTFTDSMFRRSAPRKAKVSVRSSEATNGHSIPEQRIAVGSLVVSGLTVRFGGLVAVNSVSLQAPSGRITGLIGPNGAGKTTTFNVCSGLQVPSAGTVELNGRSVERMSAASRARHGVGRTFQQVQLFDGMTVRENVMLGAEAHHANFNPLGHVVSTATQRDEILYATEAAMEISRLTSLGQRQAGTLSTGQRRLVELARCLAGSHQILLLDEPSSGLDRVETRDFGLLIRALVAEHGVGILLVEHDMSLVTKICDYIYVMDFGNLIFEGTPKEVVSSPVVQAAYLGAEIPDLVQSEGELAGERS